MAKKSVKKKTTKKKAVKKKTPKKRAVKKTATKRKAPEQLSLMTIAADARASRTIPITEVTIPDLPEPEIRGMKGSLSRMGMLETPTVYGKKAPYTISAGRRRLAAAKALDWKEVRVVLRVDDGELDAAAVTLTENAQRSDNPLSELDAIELLMKPVSRGGRGMSEREVYTSLGWSKGRLYGRLALRKLNKVMRTVLDDGRMTFSTAREVAKLNKGEQDQLATAHKTKTAEAKREVKLTTVMVKDVLATKPVPLDTSLFEKPVEATSSSHARTVSSMSDALTAIMKTLGNTAQAGIQRKAMAACVKQLSETAAVFGKAGA